MELTTEDALRLIETLSDKVQAAREALHSAERVRDQILIQADGQDGMRRAEMAQAAGMTLSRLQQIVAGNSPRRELIAHGVQMPDDLHAQLQDALGESAERLRADGYQFDVVNT